MGHSRRFEPAVSPAMSAIALKAEVNSVRKRPVISVRISLFAGDVRSLRGTKGALRRRIGEWRIIFDLHQKRRLVVMIAVKRRGSKTY